LEKESNSNLSPLLQFGKWVCLHPGTFFLLWSLWLSFLYFGLGPLSFVFMHDTGDSALPYRMALADAVAKGAWGYWDPQKVSGIDTLSMLVSPFQPDILLLALLPTWLAYGLITWAQRFIAGYFTFRLLKDSIKLDIGPAFYAGLAYSLYVQASINGHWAGFTLDNGFLCEAGLPFILWGLSGLDAGKKLSYLYAVLLGLFFSSTAWFVNAAFLLPMIFFWQFIILRTYDRGSTLLPIIFTLSWAVSSLPFIYALAVNVPLSHRADWSPLALWGDIANRNLDRYVYEKIIFVWGLISDNAVPFGLLLIGLIYSRCRDRLLVAVFALIILCLAFQPAYGLLKSIAIQHLGFLTAVSFDRIYLFVPFLVVTGAAIGVNYIPGDASFPDLFVRSPVRHWHIRPLLLTLAVAVILLQSCFVNAKILYLAVQGFNSRDLYQNPDLNSLSDRTKGSPPFRVATVAQGLQHPSLAWSYNLGTADGYINVYSKQYQQYWEQVIAPLAASNKWIHDYFHYWGSRVYLFSPFYTSSIRQLRQMEDKSLVFREYWNLNLLSLANVRFVVSPLPLQDENLIELQREHDAESQQWEKLPLISKVTSYLQCAKPASRLFIYENKLAFPRFFMVGNTRTFTDTNELLTALQRSDYNELRSTAYTIDENIGLSGKKSASISGQISLISYSSDRMTLETRQNSDGMLIITNNYSPFWNATVNGHYARIFRVHHTFQGICLKAGENRVSLEYRPPYALKFRRCLLN
jgi:hypothetical protein